MNNDIYVENVHSNEKLKDLIFKLTRKKPKNIELYSKALTHKSKEQIMNYEALEFLGDRVMSLIIAYKIYNLDWSKYNPGVGDFHNCFASFTNEVAQAKMFESLGLDEFIISQKHISRKMKADFLEAFIGAVFHEMGWAFATRILNLVALNNVKKYKSFSFITNKELKVRKKVGKKWSSFLIQYFQTEKEWEVKTRIRNRIYSIKNANIVVAREELINWLAETYDELK